MATSILRSALPRALGQFRCYATEGSTIESFIASSGDVRLVQRDTADLNRVRGLEVTLPSFGASARARLEPGSPLPPFWHLSLFQPHVPAASLRADGTERNDPSSAASAFMPPGDLERGEIQLDRLNPLRVGDEIEQVTTIDKVDRKAGGARGENIFVWQRKELRRIQKGKVDTAAAPSVTELRCHVFRRPADKSASVASATRDVKLVDKPERTSADYEQSWTPDSVALFRYSALTFNSHKIHYDAPYCRDVEGRPGLVVHGPMTATNLAALAHAFPPPNGPAHLVRFSYRATSPLIVDREIRYRGEWHGEGRQATLTAESDEGTTSMTAQAYYE